MGVKRPQLNFQTELQTAENIKQSAGSNPLTNTLEGVLGATNQATKDATSKQQTATQKVQSDTNQQTVENKYGNLGGSGGVQVVQSSDLYAPDQSTLTNQPGKPTTFEAALGLNSDMYGASTSAVDAAKSNITGAATQAKSDMENVAALKNSYVSGGYDKFKETYKSLYGKEPTSADIQATGLSNIDPSNKEGVGGLARKLQMSTSLVTDIAGNILGSNRNLGETGQLSNLEIQALNRAEGLSTSQPTSNVDALSQLLGASYDTDLNRYQSQAYENDITKARNTASDQLQQRKQAESQRVKSKEDYSTAVTQGQLDVNRALDTLSKNIESNKINAETNVDTIANKTLNEIDSMVAEINKKAPEEASRARQEAFKHVRDTAVTKALPISGSDYDLPSVSKAIDELNSYADKADSNAAAKYDSHLFKSAVNDFITKIQPSMENALKAIELEGKGNRDFTIKQLDSYIDSIPQNIKSLLPSDFITKLQAERNRYANDTTKSLEQQKAEQNQVERIKQERAGGNPLFEYIPGQITTQLPTEYVGTPTNLAVDTDKQKAKNQVKRKQSLEDLFAPGTLGI
jgi:hypothetical protein